VSAETAGGLGTRIRRVGSVSVKNTKNILIKNVFDSAIGAICWWFVGFGIAFGSDEFGNNGSNGFIGRSAFFYEGRGSGDDA
jgi:Amt family ammonium transporter